MNTENKLLIHIIDSLTYGGAEILLRNSINLLSQYNHLVIYLNKPDDLKESFNKNVEFICLQHTGWSKIVSTCWKIRHIIKKKKPALVHAHLLNSTIISRLAVPQAIPLISTIHSLYSMDTFQKNKKGLLAERLTIRKRHTIVAVSKYVLDDYLQWVPFKGKAFVLYNFLPSSYFNKYNKNDIDQKSLRCVAVGNLKEAKNYAYLLEVFDYLKGHNISLDIYGTGNMEKDLQQQITQRNLAIKLKGRCTNINDVLHQYDLFIQASSHEGFGLSVIEAIASCLPVFISDIPVFKEITNGNAHFFSLANAIDAADQLTQLQVDIQHRNMYVNNAYNFAVEQFTEQKFVTNLIGIYEQVI